MNNRQGVEYSNRNKVPLVQSVLVIVTMYTEICYIELHLSAPYLHHIIQVLTVVHTPHAIISLVATVVTVVSAGCGTVVRGGYFTGVLRRWDLLDTDRLGVWNKTFFGECLQWEIVSLEWEIICLQWEIISLNGKL